MKKRNKMNKEMIAHLIEKNNKLMEHKDTKEIHPSSINNWKKVEEYRLKYGKLPCEDSHTFYDDMELEIALSARYSREVLDYMEEDNDN